MALRVWLPLNGTLDNIGISDVTVTNNGATIDNNGKIGKCYKFNGTSSYLLGNYSPFTNNTQEWSYACWFKPENSHYGCLLSVRTATAATGITVFYYGSEFLIDDGVRWEFTPSTAVKIGEWNHLAVTRKANSGKKLYLNGELINTIATTGTPTAVSTTNFSIGASQSSATSMSGNFFNGLINDVRIYDHCLSPKEIKEISQGLVLHYKLDGFSGGSGNNLLKGGYEVYTVSNTNTPSGSLALDTNLITYAELPGKTFTFTYDYSVEGEKLYNNTGDYTKDRYGIHLSYTYTNSGGTTATSYPGAGYLTASGTGRAVQTFSIPSDITINSFAFGIQPYNKPADGNTNTWYLKNVKLEIGDKDTGWSENITDLGIDKTKIKDSSGYEKDGSINTNLEIHQDKNTRYGHGMYLNRKKINCSSGFITGDDPVFTVSLWFKLYSNITYTAYADLISFTTESYSAQPFRLELCGSPVGQNLMWFRGPSGNTGGFNVGPTESGWYTMDEWHHIALVSSGNKQYVSYFDGKQTNTFNGSAYTWAPTGGVSIGDTIEGTADMSDFRIYTTALSADDILDLYHTSANINNLGVMHGFEFKDNVNNRIMEANGTIATKNWNNSTLLKNYQQTNCQVTLTDDGLRIYRPPNIIHDSSTMHNMWGGMRINNTRDGGHPIYGNGDNPIGLEKGHTYIIAFHVKGKSSNATNNYGWSNQMGWGGGGLGPTPTDVSYDLLPSDFNGEKECWYKWTINDDIVKTCTTSYSYAVAGNQYMSYADFAFGWQYQDTGTLGSDVYITNLRLYDITDLDMSNIQKNGVINFTQLDELTQTDKASITFYKELQATGFIEK